MAMKGRPAALRRYDSAMRHLVLIVLLVLGQLASASAATLERGNGPEPDSLDAHRAQSLSAFNVLRDLYEGLVTEDVDGRLSPGLAESWVVADDGRSWTFTLREGLRWSDGAPLTADQVVASLRRALDPATLAPYAKLLEPIAGAAEVIAGRAPPETLGVEAPDPRTVIVRLARPAPLDKLLTLPVAFVVDVEAVTRHGARHTRAGNLRGNGAYRLVDWQPQTAIRLERNPHYHGAAAVPIAAVRFHVTEDPSSEMKRFLAGDLDLTESVPAGNLERLRERFGDQLVVAPMLGTFWFGFNLRRPPFRDAPELREALSLAIDREILVRHVTGFGEQPAFALVPPATDGHRDATPAHARWTQSQREARARELYARAGYSREQPLETEIRYNTSPQHRRLALAIAAMWREVLGVRTRLVNEEWKVFVVNRRAGRLTQVFRGSWIADTNDPMSFLETFRRGSPLNTSGYDDPAFDALLDAANVERDPARRAERLAEAETRLLAAHAILPVYFYSARQLVSPRVDGFRPNPMDRHPTRFLRLAEGSPDHARASAGLGWPARESSTPVLDSSKPSPDLCRTRRGLASPGWTCPDLPKGATP
jgi:oligopeptide transport system substrate-binding protein